MRSNLRRLRRLELTQPILPAWAVPRFVERAAEAIEAALPGRAAFDPRRTLRELCDGLTVRHYTPQSRAHCWQFFGVGLRCLVAQLAPDDPAERREVFRRAQAGFRALIGSGP